VKNQARPTLTTSLATGALAANPLQRKQPQAAIEIPTWWFTDLDKPKIPSVFGEAGCDEPKLPRFLGE